MEEAKVGEGAKEVEEDAGEGGVASRELSEADSANEVLGEVPKGKGEVIKREIMEGSEAAKKSSRRESKAFSLRERDWRDERLGRRGRGLERRLRYRWREVREARRVLETLWEGDVDVGDATEGAGDAAQVQGLVSMVQEGGRPENLQVSSHMKLAPGDIDEATRH